MDSLVGGVVATGSGAFQAGAPPAPKPSQSTTHKEPSTEWTESSQSTECTTPTHTPPEQLMQADGDFEKSECTLVIHLFTSSVDVVEPYPAIEDKEVW